MRTLDATEAHKESAVVAFLDDRDYSIESERGSAKEMAEHVSCSDRPYEYVEWATEVVRHPQDFSPTNEPPHLVLVVDMNMPTLKDLKAFGMTKSDPRGGFTGGITLVEQVIRAKDSILVNVPVVILSEHDFDSDVKRRIKRLRSRSSAPIKMIRKAAEAESGNSFRESLSECLHYAIRVGRPGGGEDPAPDEGSCLEAVASHSRERMFFARLMEFWDLSPEQGAVLLGIQNRDPKLLKAFLAGELNLDFSDWAERLEYLVEIRINLGSLFRSRSQERRWVREELEDLDGRSPLATMTTGRFADLLRVYGLVRVMCNL